MKLDIRFVSRFLRGHGLQRAALLLPALGLFGNAREAFAQQDYYHVVDVDTSFARDLNDAGNAVGEHRDVWTGRTMAYRYMDGRFDDFAEGVAYGGISDANHVAYGAISVRVYDGTTSTDRGSYGPRWARPIGINSAGMVLADAWDPDAEPEDSHAVLDVPGYPPTYLSHAFDGARTWGSAISETGYVAGCAAPRGISGPRMFRYFGGVMTFPLPDGLCADDIDNYGRTVGTMPTPSGPHAFYHDGTALIDLGTLGGLTSRAYGMNDRGDVVGSSDLANGDTRGFLYQASTGVMIDLSDLVPPEIDLGRGVRINNAGQILAWGRRTDGTGEERSFILTPPQDRFAYAVADRPFYQEPYVADANTSFNSSGDPIVIRRVDTGWYDVEFHGLRGFGNGLSSAFAVTPLGSTTISCSSTNFSSSLDRAVVTVYCWDYTSKRPADTAFAIMLTGNASLEAPFAYLRAGGKPADAADSGRWSSSTYAPMLINAGATGEYLVSLQLPSSTGVELAMAVSGGGSHCQPDPGKQRVRCWDHAGDPADGSFSMIQTAGGRPGNRLGYAVADDVYNESYRPASSFNSTGGDVVASREGFGSYGVTFYDLGNEGEGREHVQVSALGADWATCNLVDWQAAGADVELKVECRDLGGNLVDTPFSVLVIE